MNINLVKEAIRTEQHKNGEIWIKLSEVAKICCTKYQLAITKEWFTNNPDFRVYRTANPLEIYIALVETLPSFYSTKNGEFEPEESTLSEESVCKSESEESTFSEESVCKSESIEPVIISNSAIQISSIQSCEDLERYLYSLLKELGADSPLYFVEISVLTKHFYKKYGKPIKPVLNGLIPQLKLVEFMQCYDSFLMIKVKDRWTVTLQKLDDC
ncbi:hypothetical protein [Microcoleus sp. FACHB-68]|uniref:hypothetical protein n=1 Tax=Microcoleus sp. FACHB-68 TaxID=2692826 RepID=UPI001682D525|nr:hypothetical protein [Microcoleus sp. FACHB-68]MBD1940665.1 hypothetical protein [Microcoleus sp. FACHB-68]